MSDLFGYDAGEPGPALSVDNMGRGKHYVMPRGYAAMPGTGPEGRQCRHCAFYAHAEGTSASYPKCGLIRAKWTHGRATDILARSPSCSKFKEQPSPVDAVVTKA